MNVKMNYTVLFIMLFNSCIIAGLGLKNTVDHSMIYAVCVGMLFLIGAVFSSIKEAIRREQAQGPRID
ncbi:hypothetical protein [Priestia endophytica]|uniref:Uncharacterized protein n=1 Tax=Priestia endophytica DSM 13796 TaxID=1121089 RepID=A0A1I6BZV0_9BACI|nr:hypothetical protein [Priestia endophytica]KYG33478.1 hypothetical protein AZF06_21785 [Priestia endophytica]SFQ86460.1 hypothetical protein SAMN02745910_04644 [Priestia endophytica DSM 13796]